MKIKTKQRIETSHKYYDADADEMAFQKLELAEGIEVDLTASLPQWDKLAQRLIDLGYAEAAA